MLGPIKPKYQRIIERNPLPLSLVLIFRIFPLFLGGGGEGYSDIFIYTYVWPIFGVQDFEF